MAKVTYITPIGTARYVHLAKPDTKFNADGVYTCQLILDDKGFESFKKALDEFIDSQTWKNRKKLHMPFEELEDGEGWVIKAKSGYRVPLFDSKRRKVFDTRKDDPEDYPLIGSGSRLRFAVTFNAYSTSGEGVSLFLDSVQIIDLVEYGGSSPFDEVEGGYEANDDDEEEGPSFNASEASALEI